MIASGVVFVNVFAGVAIVLTHGEPLMAALAFAAAAATLTLEVGKR